MSPPAPSLLRGVSSGEIGKDLADAPAQDVRVLRAALEKRLAALEAALANPDHGGPLETLVLDLARVATQEAEATTERAILDAEARAAAARNEALKSGMLLEGERAAGRTLGQELENARSALKAAEKASVAFRRDLEQAQAAAQAEREARAALGREVEAARSAFEAEREAGLALRHDIERAQAALDTERAAGDRLHRDIQEARAALDGERATSTALRRKLEETEQRAAAAGAAKEAEVRELKEQFGKRSVQERAVIARLTEAVAKLQAELAAARSRMEAQVADLEQSRARAEALDQDRLNVQRARDEAEARADALTRERDEAATALEAARRELDAARAQVAARIEAAGAECANLELRLQETEERLETSTVEREAMAAELEVLRQAVCSAQAEAHAYRQQLRETEERIRALELESMRRDLKVRERDVELSALLEGAADDPDPIPINGSRDFDAGAAGTGDIPPALPDQPVRCASRRAFQEDIQVQVDGGAARLVDLSVSGAQVLAPTSLKPNRLVRVLLPFGEGAIACKGKIVWARLEPPSHGGSLRYRAGVYFTSVDEDAIEAFLARHA